MPAEARFIPLFQSQSSIISLDDNDDDEVDPATAAATTFSNIMGRMMKAMTNSTGDKTIKSGEEFREELDALANAFMNLAKRMNKTLDGSTDNKTINSDSNFRKERLLNVRSLITLAPAIHWLRHCIQISRVHITSRPYSTNASTTKIISKEFVYASLDHRQRFSGRCYISKNNIAFFHKT